MKLHHDKKRYAQAVRFASQHIGIPEIYIEKDYWVTLALKHVFTSEIGKELIFKGGTALSKAYKLIERFSEDIDLVLVTTGKESGNQVKRKLQEVSTLVNTIMPEVVDDDLTRKRGMNRKTVHSYSQAFQGVFGQVRDKVVIETTSYGTPEPYEVRPIQSMIGEVLRSTGQIDLIVQYELEAFDVAVLHPNKVLCEKIMSLVRFSYFDNPEERLKQKVRHLYDLHALLGQKRTIDFVKSPSFEQIMMRVAMDDMDSYPNNNAWLEQNPRDAIVFKEWEHVWKSIQMEYKTTFGQLVYGELPTEKDISDTMSILSERLDTLNWNSVRLTMLRKSRNKDMDIDLER